MTSDLDICRSANLLMKQHGEGAPIHAAMRADAMLEAGDLDGLRCGSGYCGRWRSCRGRSLGHGCIEARSRGWIFLMYRNSNVGFGGKAEVDLERLDFRF